MCSGTTRPLRLVALNKAYKPRVLVLALSNLSHSQSSNFTRATPNEPEAHLRGTKDKYVAKVLGLRFISM